MDLSVIHPAALHDPGIAEENRARLQQAGVFTVNLIGSLGCGKTSLIGETVARLVYSLHIGVIASDPETHRDADRIVRASDQTVQIETGEGSLLEPSHVRSALDRLDLDRLDLLVIENISSIIGPAEIDLGEHAKVGMFCVTDGDDKAEKYPDLVRNCDALILNKIDLLPNERFHLGAFRNDVHRTNPKAPLFEMSVLENEGVDAWLAWLREHLVKRPRR